jgi:HemY protein
MRTLFWILALFGIAVGLALAARYNAGYVMVVFPTRRLELSVNFAVLLAMLGFVALYLLVRGVGAAIRLPAAARAYHARRRHEEGRAALREALFAFFEGRHGRAGKAAAQALKAGEEPALAAVIAARAAHETRAYAARDDWLLRLEGIDADADVLRRVTQADLLLGERRWNDALAVLEPIAGNHTAALRLELRALQQAGRWDRVLALLPQLERKQALDRTALVHARRHAAAGLLERSADAPEALADAWGRMPAELRTDEVVARAAAQAFMDAGRIDDAHRLIEAALDHAWDSPLVALYAARLGADAQDQLVRAEAWLPAHPRDANLLLTLGRLCAFQGLWGKSERFFDASLAVEPSHAAHLELAQLALRAGDDARARAHERAALDLALARIDPDRRRRHGRG